MEAESLSLACLTTLVADAVTREVQSLHRQITRAVLRRVRAQLRKKRDLIRRPPRERGARPAPRTFEEDDLFTDSETTSDEPESEPTGPNTTPSSINTHSRFSHEIDSTDGTSTHRDSAARDSDIEDAEALLDGRPPISPAPRPRSSQYSTDLSVWVSGSQERDSHAKHSEQAPSKASSDASVEIIGIKWSADHFRKRRRLEQK